MRYVSFNPVRARLAERPQDWTWSSVRAHVAGADDELVRVQPAPNRYGDFARFLGEPVDHKHAWLALRRSKSSGRPLGSSEWLADLEARTGRTLAPQKRGPKPKNLCI
ncbi:MAG TPA: hypothetical protein VGF77_18015 [Allosphingosinicella sp.]|jgi:putative transposase